MGYFGKSFDFTEDSNIEFSDGIFQLTIIGSPKYDEEQQRTLLKEVGLDFDELKTMDKEERDKLLNDNKLNPDDFSFEVK